MLSNSHPSKITKITLVITLKYTTATQSILCLTQTLVQNQKRLILHSAANPYIYYLRNNPNQDAYQSLLQLISSNQKNIFLSPNISFLRQLIKGEANHGLQQNS